jgi:hypothetical protein
MIYVSITQTSRIFNFDSEVVKIDFKNGLSIFKFTETKENNKQHSYFKIKKEYKFKYTSIEYSIIPSDYFEETTGSFHVILSTLKLFKNSAVFIDRDIITEIYENGKKKSLKFIDNNYVVREKFGDSLIIKKDDIPVILKLYKKNNILKEDKNINFFLAKNMLNYGMNKIHPGDAVIDYFTGLEAIFIRGSSDNLSYRLSILVAAILGKSQKFEEKKEIFEFIKDMYNLRSRLVHGDRSKESIKFIIKKLNRPNLLRLEEYLRNSLKLFIKRPDNFNEENLLKILLK